jgi:hypothetical protein
MTAHSLVLKIRVVDPETTVLTSVTVGVLAMGSDVVVLSTFMVGVLPGEAIVFVVFATSVVFAALVVFAFSLLLKWKLSNVVPSTLQYPLYRLTPSDRSTVFVVQCDIMQVVR